MSEKVSIYISITDRDPNVRETLEDIFRRYGFDIATNPKDAVIIVANSQQAWNNIQKDVTRRVTVIAFSYTRIFCPGHCVFSCIPRGHFYGGEALVTFLENYMKGILAVNGECACSK